MWRRMAVVVMWGGLGLAGCAHAEELDSPSVTHPSEVAALPEALAALALAPDTTAARREGDAQELARCPRVYALRLSEDLLGRRGAEYVAPVKRYAATIRWQGDTMRPRATLAWDDDLRVVDYTPPSDALVINVAREGLRWRPHSRDTSLWDGWYNAHMLFEAWGPTPPKPWRVRHVRDVVVRGHAARWWRFERPEQTWISHAGRITETKNHDLRRLDVLIASDGTLMAARHVHVWKIRLKEGVRLVNMTTIRLLHLTSACGRPVFDEPPHASPPEAITRTLASWLKARPPGTPAAGRTPQTARWSAHPLPTPRSSVREPPHAWKVSARWDDHERCDMTLHRTTSGYEVSEGSCTRELE